MIDEQLLLERFSPEHPKYGQIIELGQRLGAAGLNELMEMWGGEKKHIPKANTFWEKLYAEVRNDEMKTRFNGRNYDELAIEYKMDVRNVYRIVHGKRSEQGVCPRCNQMFQQLARHMETQHPDYKALHND